MEFKQVIGDRRTIRFFDPNRPVEPEKIQIILEAANLSSRAVNADFAKAIVCLRDELRDGRRRVAQDADHHRPVRPRPGRHLLVRRLDVRRGRRQERLKELIDLGALPGHARLVARLRRRGRLRAGGLADVARTRWRTCGRSRWSRGLTICQALLAAVDEGLGIGLHAFNAEVAKEALDVPDTWIPMWMMLVGYPAEDRLGGGARPRRSWRNTSIAAGSAPRGRRSRRDRQAPARPG